MLNTRVLPLACAAVLWLGGVSAGPCKPRLTSVSSYIDAAVTDTATSSVIEIIETSSTEATLTAGTGALTDEPSPTTTSETTDIYVTMSTTVEVSTTSGASTTAEASATAEASTTATTTTAEACVATNIIQNPNFDSSSDGSPWILNDYAFLTTFSPRSAPKSVVFYAEASFQPISQIVPGLEPAKEYIFSYYWTFGGSSPAVDCSITVSAGVVLDTFSISSDNPFQYVERQFDIPANTITSTTISISAACDSEANVLIDDVSMIPACV